MSEKLTEAMICPCCKQRIPQPKYGGVSVGFNDRSQITSIRYFGDVPEWVRDWEREFNASRSAAQEDDDDQS